jgi:hypothetical protein
VEYLRLSDASDGWRPDGFGDLRDPVGLAMVLLNEIPLRSAWLARVLCI